MKKLLIALAIVVVLGAAGVGVYANFFRDTSASGRVSSDSEDAVYVDSVTSITGYGSGSGLMERFAGEVEPQATLEVRLESERKLKECYVQVGDVVKEGQKLFSYNTQEDEDNIAQAELEIEKAEAENEASEQTIAQYEKERESASSDDQIEYSLEIASQENSIKQNEYTIKQKELEIEQLQENIDDAVVTAEMGGIVQKISDEDSSESSYSSSDSSVYITILAEGDYRIKGSINELQIDQIEEGEDVIVYSRVDNSVSWLGQIAEVTEDTADDENDSYYYYNSSADTTSYVFYVDLESSEGLMLGQHVYLEEYVGQDKDRDGLWLDEYYLFWEEEDPYVWAASTSNVIEKRALTVGDYDEELEQYEILEGLDADDYIAFPSDSVSAGDPVIYNDIPSSNEDEEYDDEDYDDYDDYDYEDFDDYDDYDDDDDFYDDNDYYEFDDDDDDDFDDYDDDDYDDDDDFYDDEDDDDDDDEYFIYDDDDD